jgi:hypothetical protein
MEMKSDRVDHRRGFYFLPNTQGEVPSIGKDIGLKAK